jgi:hypothetical protein
VYFSFPRSFENEIVFEIPEGFTVSGLDKLNKNVNNEAGSFVSTAKISGNQLVVQVKKSYTNYYEPNANWPKVVDFLEAAYQFTCKKRYCSRKAKNPLTKPFHIENCKPVITPNE